MWPIQLAFLLSIVHSTFLSLFESMQHFFHFPHAQSNWSSPSLSSTRLQLPRYFWSTFRSVLKFQHHTQLCSKYFFANFFLKFKPSFLATKNLLLTEHCFYHGKPRCNSSYTSCTICYPATQIVYIFHILQLILCIIICNGDGCLQILITSVFLQIHLHSIASSNSVGLSIMPCSPADKIILEQFSRAYVPRRRRQTDSQNGFMRLGISGSLTKINREKLNVTQNREGPQKDHQKTNPQFHCKIIYSSDSSKIFPARLCNTVIHSMNQCE